MAGEACDADGVVRSGSRLEPNREDMLIDGLNACGDSSCASVILAEVGRA